MNYLYLGLGLLVFFLTVSDIIKTTFSAKGGGTITNLLSKAIWKCFYHASGKKGKNRLLEYAGSAILVSVILTWVLGLWSSLFLLLLSDPDSVLKSSTHESTGSLEKLYFAGFTLSTLGVGDYVASNNVWRVLTSIYAFSGLAFITASITYFVPALSAVAMQHKLGLYINGMGKTPQELVLNSWNGKDCSSFFDNVPDLCQLLVQHTMNHHSYPVIHYFHSSRRGLAVTQSIVLLDEAYSLLAHVMKDQEKENKMMLSMLQTALDQYLEMVQENFLVKYAPHAHPPVPDLSRLQQAGIQTKNEQEVEHIYRNVLYKRRSLLTSILHENGWSWDDVYRKHEN